MNISVDEWRSCRRTLLNFAHKNWKYTAFKQHCVSVSSSLPTQPCMLACCSSEMLRLRNIWRQSSPHHRAKRCQSYFWILFVEASRNFIIFPLLTKKFPVTHKVSLAEHWSRHSEIRWNEQSWNYKGSCVYPGCRNVHVPCCELSVIHRYPTCCVCWVLLFYAVNSAIDLWRLTTTALERFPCSVTRLYYRSAVWVSLKSAFSCLTPWCMTELNFLTKYGNAKQRGNLSAHVL